MKENPGGSAGSIINIASTSAYAALPDMVAMAAAMSPMNRIGQASDLAGAAVYLAGDDSSFVTGSDLLVDGGMLAVHPGY